MPKRIEIVSKLNEDIKKLYLELTQMLDDDEKRELEKKINSIKDVNSLTNFIVSRYKNYRAYKEALQYLPKPERVACKQKFMHAIHADDTEKVIDQYQNNFKIINDVSIQTKQHYIDLLEVLPDNQAIILKNKILQATDPIHVDQLITSHLPNQFKKLDEATKTDLASLADDKRQEVLKKAMSQHTVPAEVKANTVSHSDATDQKTTVDISNLIEQKKEEDKDIPQDEWGKRLILRGKEREQFLLYTMEFENEDRKKLKELFHKTKQQSLNNLAEVMFKAFKTDEERKDLLETIIYLYKGWPSDTLMLCNDPDSLGTFKKLQLFWRTNKYQIRLLTKLDNAITALDAENSK